jgi:hypothetical protein
VYQKVWRREGSKGDLVGFLGLQPARDVAAGPSTP